jgi:hypothetical protein
VGSTGQHIPTLDVGLRGGDGLLRLNDGQECHANGALHVEACQRFVGTCPGDGGVGAVDAGIAEPKVEGLPRKERPRRAAPCALRRDGGQRRTGNAGDDRLRQEQACHVVDRGPIHLPEAVEPRQIGGLRNRDAGGRDVHLLDRGLDGWIVVEGILQRVLQREDLSWCHRLGRRRRLCLGRPGKDTQDGHDSHE